LINNPPLLLVGYSGHAYVACDIFLSNGITPNGYFDNEKKVNDPYQIQYLGKENAARNIDLLRKADYFVAIGDNNIRSKIIKSLQKHISKMPVNAIHKNSFVSSTAILGKGIMVGVGAVINACSKIKDGVICNTQSVIEHECEIDKFSHIAPGAVLCGNVKVGKHTFVGARAVIKQGVTIGDNVIIGAGTVIINDIPNNSKVIGNPQKFI